MSEESVGDMIGIIAHQKRERKKKSPVVFRRTQNVVGIYYKDSLRYAFEPDKERVDLVKTQYDNFGIWIVKKTQPFKDVNVTGIVWLN